MTRKLRFGFALSALILLAPAFSRAARATDTISNFNVEGTAQNNSGGALGTCAYYATCPFSGTMGVDITTGKVVQFDVTFPGLPTFSNIFNQTANQVASYPGNTEQWTLDFNFTASPTADTLVGFTGGTIDGSSSITNTDLQNLMYTALTGTISAASTVPEPGSLALLAAGLLGLGFVMWRRKRHASLLA